MLLSSPVSWQLAASLNQFYWQLSRGSIRASCCSVGGTVLSLHGHSRQLVSDIWRGKVVLIVLQPAVLGVSRDETVADPSGLELKPVFQCVLNLVGIFCLCRKLQNCSNSVGMSCDILQFFFPVVLFISLSLFGPTLSFSK